jgi:hypothetical protein
MPARAAPVVRRGHERIAVIDLGGLGGGADAVHQLHAAIVAAGFTPVVGDGLEDALAGRDVDRDAQALAVEMASATRAFGLLACGEVTPAARRAIGLSAARQASGLPAPELPRAWAYVLLCADRDGQFDTAAAAALQLRALGGSPDVPAAVLAKYPDIDAVANPDLVELDIETDTPGAQVWIDFRPIGTAPVHVAVAVGDHVIAAATGTKRGWAAGTAIRAQKAVKLELTDAAGPWAEVARKIAGWKAAPPPAELAAVLARVHARVALIRRGDEIEAWGHVGATEEPHLLGGDDGTAPVADVARVLGVIADRVAAWSAHAPDPDRPLLLDDQARRGGRRDQPATPTKWWVYAAIGGAIAIGAGIIVANEAASDRQRVELHYP